MTSTPRFPLRRAPDGAADSGECAVVLLRVSDEQFHLGLRHRCTREERGIREERVIHLAWHRDLREEPLIHLLTRRTGLLPSAILALSLDIDLDSALQVLALRVWARHASTPGLAYGFGDQIPPFDPDSALPTEPDAAFTCATFVLALLRSVGVELIDPSRWRPPTESDLEWQRAMGARLIADVEQAIHGDLYDPSDTPENVRLRVERTMGSRRYRPPDVAAAATLSPARWPASAEEIAPRANELVSHLSG